MLRIWGYVSYEFFKKINSLYVYISHNGILWLVMFSHQVSWNIFQFFLLYVLYSLRNVVQSGRCNTNNFQEKEEISKTKYYSPFYSFYISLLLIYIIINKRSTLSWLHVEFEYKNRISFNNIYMGNFCLFLLFIFAKLLHGCWCEENYNLNSTEQHCFVIFLNISLLFGHNAVCCLYNKSKCVHRRASVSGWVQFIVLVWGSFSLSLNFDWFLIVSIHFFLQNFHPKLWLWHT